ncbi:MAG: acyl-CoA thioesterase [Bacteroidota bacterium]
MEGFNFSIPVHIRWQDLDPLGHVNNAVFVTYFEMARGAYISKVCQDWDWKQHIFLIASVHVDFIQELLLTASPPEVHVRTSRIGNKSFNLEYAITTLKDGEEILHATGSTAQVMFDPVNRKTIPMADWIREALTGFDGPFQE